MTSTALSARSDGDRDFDSQLGQEVHDIFGAAIDLGVALLAAVALDLGHRHAVDADGGQRLAHLVKLEGFDDRDDEFHGQAFISQIFEQSAVARLMLRSSQIWHLSVQMAQKSCRLKRKTLPGLVLLASLYRGSGIVRQNAVSFAGGPCWLAARSNASRDEMSNRSWFYASEGQQQGPYPEAQLRDFIARGTVRADTLVWTEGMAGWQRAGDIPGPGRRAASGPPLDSASRRPAGDRPASYGGGPLSIDFGILEFTWRSLVLLIGLLFVIPAPWVLVWYYQVDRVLRARAADGRTRLHRPGDAIVPGISASSFS